MKHLLIFCFVIVTAVPASAQTALAAAPTAMNVLYRGLKNPLKIVAEGCDCDSLIVSISNAEEKNLGDCRWEVLPGRGYACVVSVSRILGPDTVYVGKNEFRVKPIPDPLPYFGGKTFHHHEMQWRDAAAAQGVIAKMENFEFDLRFNVVSFDFEADTGSGWFSIHAKGPRIPKMAHRALITMKTGGSFRLTNIMAIGPDSTERKLRDIALTVVPSTVDASWPESVRELENLHTVHRNLYRSEQPSKEAFKALERTNIRTILNLRSMRSDQRLANDSVFTLHHLRINTWRMSGDDLIEALRIINGSKGSTLVHCKHGSDRTGAVIAAYRVVVQGWNKEAAIIEMTSDKNGFHAFWFGNLETLIRDMDVTHMRSQLGLE